MGERVTREEEDRVQFEMFGMGGIKFKSSQRGGERSLHTSSSKEGNK